MRNKATEISGFFRRQPRWRVLSAGVVLLLAVLWFFSGGKSAMKNAPTFVARRGPLDITVLEGGSLKALESQEIKCEVRVGYQGAKILKIVPEGYFVTEEDVRTNKVLCELDSSDLQNKLVQQEIQYQSAMANLADAEQNYQIQLGQNDSDIKAAQQKGRFARMDFEKYLGDSVAGTIIAEVGLDKILAAISSNSISVSAVGADSRSVGVSPASASDGDPARAITVRATMAKAVKATMAQTNSDTDDPPEDPSTGEDKPMLEIPDIVLDFSKYANLDALGDGEAKQKLRQLDDALQVAQKDLGQASTTLEGTRRLFDKGFVPKTEVTRDEISYESAILKVKKF